MTTSSDNTVEINILSQKFIVRRGDALPEHVIQVAAYVDSKMAEIQSRTQSVSTSSVAILAALNIAHELFKNRALTADSLQNDRVEEKKVTLHLESQMAQKDAKIDTLTREVQKRNDELKLLIEKYVNRDDDFKKLSAGVRGELEDILVLVNEELAMEQVEIH